MTWGVCALCGHSMDVHDLFALTKKGVPCAGCPDRFCENETPEGGDSDVEQRQLVQRR